jgi:hypothetical protein
LNGRIDVGKRLIDQGAQLDLLDGDGRTALHLAAAAMSKEVLELLTRRGASVVIRDKNGMRYMEVWKQKKRRRGEGRIQGSTQGHQAPLKAWGYHIGAMSLIVRSRGEHMNTRHVIHSTSCEVAQKKASRFGTHVPKASSSKLSPFLFSVLLISL